MNKMMTLTPSQFVNKVLMKIKVYSALSPADTHAHLFPDVSLVSAAPEDLTPHIGGAGPGLQEGPCGPHLLPCPPCWDNWVPCSPPCVPSHPNRRGQGVMGWSGGQAAASCMLAPGLPEWGHSSVQGARSRPRSGPRRRDPSKEPKGRHLGWHLLATPQPTRHLGTGTTYALPLHKWGALSDPRRNGLGGPSRSTHFIP